MRCNLRSHIEYLKNPCLKYTLNLFFLKRCCIDFFIIEIYFYISHIFFIEVHMKLFKIFFSLFFLLSSVLHACEDEETETSLKKQNQKNNTSGFLRERISALYYTTSVAGHDSFCGSMSVFYKTYYHQILGIPTHLA